MEGRTLGRYKLIEEIGQGGMAVVYRGMDTALQREVAVKILHPHLSRKPANRQRFEREARTVAKLRHDNIVEIFDYSGGEEAADGGERPAEDAFIVTEYIRGSTLADFLAKEAPLPAEIGALMTVEICDALAHAHDLGIVHRDIKPENVMIRQDGMLKLMDFGIARVQDESGGTMTGALMGSPQYMSPEQFATGELDHRSDLFSLGVLLYRLVTGRMPFEGATPQVLMRAISEEEPVDAAHVNPLVPRAIAAACRRALAKAPAERHDGVRALAADLVDGLAEAAMGAPREELRAYFADPAGYALALRGRLIERYARIGHERARKFDTAGAMEMWSRVLELDPGNAEVRAQLDRIGGRRRMRRLAVRALAAAATLAAVGVAGAQGWRWVRERRENAAAGTARDSSPATASLPDAAAAAAAVATPTSGSAAPTTPDAAETAAATDAATPNVAPTPRRSPGARRLAMLPTPRLPEGTGALNIGLEESATITVDGATACTFLDTDGPAQLGDCNTFDTRHRDIVLSPGTHRIRIAAAANLGCQPLEGTVEIREGGRTSRLDVGGSSLSGDQLYLRGCPTFFTVEVPIPEPAAVWIDDREVGKTGEVLSTSSGPHILKVEHATYGRVVRHVDLKSASSLDPVVLRLPITTP